MKILDTPRSGSVAGVTASRNRFGQYYRTRAIPVQPRTPKQTSNRANLTAGASAWRTLTDVQRTAWNDYAAQITRSDRLGSGYSPTGAALYTGATAFTGIGALTVPPTSLPTYVLQITGMTYTDPTPGPEAFTVALADASADNNFTIETSGPVSPGVTSAAAVRRWQSLPSNSRNMGQRYFTFATTSVAILSEYKFLYPSPLPGQVIWFRFREIFVEPLGIVGVVNSLRQTFRFVVP